MCLHSLYLECCRVAQARKNDLSKLAWLNTSTTLYDSLSLNNYMLPIVQVCRMSLFYCQVDQPSSPKWVAPLGAGPVALLLAPNCDRPWFDQTQSRRRVWQQSFDSFAFIRVVLKSHHAFSLA
jgi:hypothetical protein